MRDRFLAFVSPEPNSGCWLWAGAVDTGGYGAFSVSGVIRGAHRVSYELFVGPIPEGLQIDHLCRVPCCVNPDHMEPVTQQKNQRRGHINGNTQKTHCVHGHEFTTSNTSIDKYGGRHCRTCQHRWDTEKTIRRSTDRKLRRLANATL